MKNKIFIQLFLLIIFVFFIILFYFKYFSKKEQKVELLDKDVQIALKKSETNLIKDIEYLSYDDQGNEYLIYSKFAEISASEPEVIFMRIVTAKINSIGREPIIIKSDKAKYNKSAKLLKTEGNTKIITSEGYIVTGKNITFDNSNKIISSPREEPSSDPMSKQIILNPTKPVAPVTVTILPSNILKETPLFTFFASLSSSPNKIFLLFTHFLNNLFSYRC